MGLLFGDGVLGCADRIIRASYILNSQSHARAPLNLYISNYNRLKKTPSRPNGVESLCGSGGDVGPPCG